MQLWNLAVLLTFLRRYTTMNSANRRYNLNLNIKGNGTHEYTIYKKQTTQNVLLTLSLMLETTMYARLAKKNKVACKVTVFYE